MQRRKLGVNIDHVATVRQARGTRYPQPLVAAALSQQAGADQITVHLREDRRHIQDHDLVALREMVEVPLNLEMAATQAMLEVALKVHPDRITLVPERRQERTTEGGLDVVDGAKTIGKIVAALDRAGIPTSLFIAPHASQLAASVAVGAAYVELHTGAYCDASAAEAPAHLERLREATEEATALHLKVACGHGLNYHNVAPLVPIAGIEEYNIGHSIVAHAMFVGFERAVRDMLALLSV